MSYNYTGVPNASIPPIMSNMGMPGPIMPGPQGYINPMLPGQPGGSGNAPPPPNTSYNMVIPPGMNDSPLEFNMNKNNPPMPIETNSNNGRQSTDDDDNSSGRGDDGNGRRSNRNRNRNDRRSIGNERNERKDDRRPSKDRERRDKESRPVDDTTSENLGSGNLPSSSSDQSTAAAAVTPNMWSGMMGMGYPMMGMIMDPNIMGMNNYGMMQPPMMPDGAMLPQETLDAAAANMVPAAAVVKEILTFKLCTLIPPPPNAPPSTTRERPPGCRTVFVGGLPENITEEILIEVFERCGEISTLRLSKKNFCHIRFVYENSVDAAIFLSGYRIRIANKMDPPNSGRLHVDYAQARDDQYEWECRQRALQREQRHRERMEEERMRPPSPPPVVHYTDHEAAAICDKIKQDESFTKAAQTLLTWLERGDCNKRNANTFYSMIQSTNAHVRRLLGEKNQYEEELQKAEEIMKGRMQGILIQFGQIERVFSAATHKKVWDHFTKAQRKNIDMWRKQSQEIKTVQLEDIFNERGDEEMDVSDTEDEPSSRKRPKISTTDSLSDEKTQQLKDENDSLRCQLEAYKNEVDIVRSDLKMAVDQKDKQIKMLQQTLKGMQQQLLDSKRKQSEDEGRMKDLQAQLDVCTQNEKSSLNVLSSTHVITLDDEPPIIDLDGSKSRSNSPEIEEPSTSVVVTSNQTQINERDAKLIGLISTFLLVHPFGAGLDYIWSYVQKLEPVIKPSEVETLMSRFPKVFVQELSGVGANIERRWQFKGYQQNSTVQGP